MDVEAVAIDLKEKEAALFAAQAALCAEVAGAGREAVRWLSGLWAWPPSRIRRLGRVYQVFGDSVSPAHPLDLYIAAIQAADALPITPEEALDKALALGWSASDLREWMAGQQGEKESPVVLRGEGEVEYRDDAIIIRTNDVPDRRPSRVRWVLRSILVVADPPPAFGEGV